jgi:transposase
VKIKAALKAPEFASKRSILKGFKGIGELSAAAPIAFLPELGTLTKARVAALIGVAPFADESGSSCKGKRRISGGRSAVRAALYMSTLTAVRHFPTRRSSRVSLSPHTLLGELGGFL